LGLTHFNEHRIAKLIFQVHKSIDSTLLLARLFVDGTIADRQRWQEQRVYEDDWFMQRLGIPF